MLNSRITNLRPITNSMVRHCEVICIFRLKDDREMGFWQFAHHYFGRIWLVVGAIMIVPSVVTMLFVIGQSVGVIGTFGGILCAIQLVFLVVSIFPTEKALKDNFDQYGKRKKV